MSRWDLFPVFYADVWGDGNYAYLSHFGDSGVHIIDISNPAMPVEVAEVRPGPPNQFASAQDVQVTDGLMFIALEADGNDGVLIVDVRDPTNPIPRTRVKTPNYSNVHELYYDKGILYLAGGAGPMVGMVDLTDYDIDNPPSQITNALWTLPGVGDQFVHSITVRNGRLYCCAWSSGLWVYDVSRVRTQLPTFLGSAPGENVHTCWPTEDGRYVVTGEEHDLGGIKLFEITQSNGTSINLSERDSVILPIDQAYSVHNPIFVGDRLYVAWYQAGLHVFDLNRQTKQLEFAASFDTFAPPVQGFNGNWGVFPFLGENRVLLSDISNGLYVINVGGTARISPILPSSLHPVYPTVVQASVSDAMNPIDPDTVTLHRFLPDDPDADILMTPLGNGLFEAVVPRQKCSTPLDLHFSAQTLGDETVYAPLGAPTAMIQLLAVTAEIDVIHDDFEQSGGWTVGAADDDAPGGVWVRGVPNGTSAQPSSGNPAGSGGSCFFTGQADPGAAADAADVDRGKTTLRSPMFNAADGDLGFGYAFWYVSNFDGFFASDGFEVSISNNAGVTWTIVDRVFDSTNAWVEKSFRISDFITPTATMQVRFVAFDLGPKSIVEAAIDDFRVFEFDCSEQPGDDNGDGSVTLNDFADFPGCLSGPFAGFGEACLIYDVDNDLDVDVKDFRVIQLSFTGSP